MNICTMLIASPGQVLSTTWAFLTATTWAVLMYLGTICHSVAHVIHLDLKRPGLHSHEIIKFAMLTNVIIRVGRQTDSMSREECFCGIVIICRMNVEKSSP